MSIFVRPRLQLQDAHAVLDAAGVPPSGSVAERIRMLDRAWAMRLQLAEADTAQWQSICMDSHGALPEEGIS